jgi:hypothetical protein
VAGIGRPGLLVSPGVASEANAIPSGALVSSDSRGSEGSVSIAYRHRHVAQSFFEPNSNGISSYGIKRPLAQMKQRPPHRPFASPVQLRRIGIHRTAGVCVHVAADFDPLRISGTELIGPGKRRPFGFTQRGWSEAVGILQRFEVGDHGSRLSSTHPRVSEQTDAMWTGKAVVLRAERSKAL